MADLAGVGEAVLDLERGETARDRRNREVTSSVQQVHELVALKVLHGWLQNRHQTLMPLSLNVGRLPPAERDAAMRFAAVAALAGDDPEAPDRLRQFLARSGADEAALAGFDVALAHPPPLSVAISDVQGAQGEALAFVLALVAGQDRGEAGRSFAAYVAARLGLPGTAIRSAERRFRH